MSSELSKKFGNYLQRAQSELKMTQADFGKLIGLSRNQIHLYHKGESEADLALVERVAKALGKNPSDLIKTDSISELIVKPPSEEDIFLFIKNLFEAKKQKDALFNDPEIQDVASTLSSLDDTQRTGFIMQIKMAGELRRREKKHN